jgi:hypothetical protein
MKAGAPRACLSPASQRADDGHLARRGASPAIAGRRSRAGAQGSAEPARAAHRGQAEVTERRAPAAESLTLTDCSMGSGASGAGEGCSVAVHLGSGCPARGGGRTVGWGG